MARWFFKKHNGYDDINSSTAAESFLDRSIPDMATALVREGVQNAMDARRSDLPPTEPVRVRLTLARAGGAHSNNPRWFGDLFPHLDRRGVGAPEAPNRRDLCDILIFEDFGTRGLTGNFRAPYTPGEDNNFVNFLYHEGVTDKGNQQRGSRGVGKVVFHMASRARTFFAYTIRQDEVNAPFLVGKNLLKLRKIGESLYLGPAYFLEQWEDGRPREPISNPADLEAFRSTFPISRTREPGLSVVIPFVDPSITPESLRTAIVTEYHYAILARKLEVTVIADGREEHFTADHLPSLGKPHVDEEVALARWALAQTEPPALVLDPPPPETIQTLTPTLVPEGARARILHELNERRPVRVRLNLFVHPRDRDPQEAHFDLFLQHSEGASVKPVFIRELLPVTDVREARSAAHVRGLVVIDEGPLANLLRAAEGANHTDWSPRTDQFKEKYRGRLGEIAYVARALADLMAIVRGDSERPVGGIATQFFSATKKEARGRGGRTPQPKPVPPDPPPPPSPKPYRVHQVADGFMLSRGDSDARLPNQIVLRVAYDVTRGSPWSDYDRADFDFTDPAGGIVIDCVNARVERGGKGNRLVVFPQEEDFSITVTGFDTNRDLIIDPKAEKEEVHGDSLELHVAEETLGA